MNEINYIYTNVVSLLLKPKARQNTKLKLSYDIYSRIYRKRQYIFSF